MIEKLEPIKAFNCSDTPQAKMQHHNYHNDCIKKINELVDAVNEIMTWRFDCDDETHPENVQPDAESRPVNVQKWNHWDDDEVQRYGAVARGFKSLRKEPAENVHAVCPAVKYMGKVCRFWNGGNGKKFKNIGVLIEILSADNKRRYTCASKPKKHFEFCEPVKPDDDIIYKGE